MINFRTIIGDRLAPRIWLVRVEALFRPACDRLHERIDSAIHGAWTEAYDGRILGAEIGFLEGVIASGLAVTDRAGLVEAGRRTSSLMAPSFRHEVAERFLSWLREGGADHLFAESDRPLSGLFIATDQGVDRHVAAEPLLAHMATRLDAIIVGRTLLACRFPDRGASPDIPHARQEASRSLHRVAGAAGMTILRSPWAGNRTADAARGSGSLAGIGIFEIPTEGLRACADSIGCEASADIIDIMEWCATIEEGYYRTDPFGDDIEIQGGLFRSDPF